MTERFMPLAKPYCAAAPFTASGIKKVLRHPTHGEIYNYWWALPALALASDYLEDFCHLRYRTLHAAGAKPSAMLSTFSRSMSMIKFAAVSVSALLTGFAALAATYSRRGPRREMEAPLVRGK
jgi:hypothetical protein